MPIRHLEAARIRNLMMRNKGCDDPPGSGTVHLLQLQTSSQFSPITLRSPCYHYICHAFDH